jgi:hypothetical protein
MAKITPRPVCCDCGHEATTDGDGAEIWTITKDGWWLCNDCWMDSFNNDVNPLDEKE